MSATRKISWATAMHEIAGDRAQRAPVREEPLRIPLRGPHTLTFWRGESGERYPAHIVPLDRADDFVSDPTVVAMAVRREANGFATPIAARALGDRTKDLGWLAACCATYGATELHVCQTLMRPGLARVAARDLTVSPPSAVRSAA